MLENILTPAQEASLWREARRRLELIYVPALPTEDEVNSLLAALPRRSENQSIADWLRACRAAAVPHPLDQLRQWLDNILTTLETLPAGLREVGDSIRVYLSAEQGLIQRLEERTQPIIDILSDFVNNAELHGLWQLGQGDLIQPNPFFYTAVREFPKEIRWPKKEATAQYEFRLLNYDTDEWMIDPIVTTDTVIDLASLFDPLDSNIRYEWRVYAYENDECPDDPWINGIFWLLPAETQESLAIAEEECEGLVDSANIDAILRATLYTQYELYQEVVELLTPLIAEIKESVDSIPLRRALAAAYRKAYNSCSSGVVPFWSEGYVNEILNEEVKQIYCLELGLYKTYQADGCEQCNQCGLIRQ